MSEVITQNITLTMILRVDKAPNHHEAYLQLIATYNNEFDYVEPQQIKSVKIWQEGKELYSAEMIFEYKGQVNE